MFELRIIGDGHGSAKFDGKSDVTLELTVDRAKISEMTKLVTTASYAENAGSAVTAVSANYAAECKGKSAFSECDGEGNNIAGTYVKKNEIPTFEIIDDENCIVVNFGEKKYKIGDVEVLKR